MDFQTNLERDVKEGRLPAKLGFILQRFYQSYENALKKNGNSIDKYTQLFKQFLTLIEQQISHPYAFEPYHERIRQPFDYYQFGLDFLRPLVVFEKSSVLRLSLVEKMESQLANGENVILFANHQTEPDPQAISLLLEKEHPFFAEGMIFVAGHRVITDPLAIPLSMGRNLLCIYSKKHMEYPADKKHEKQLHNQRVMKQMSHLLTQGGKCIYVAPSGGRDRPDANGIVDVAHFDAQSVEMFWLMSQQAERPTHFYPLALATYELLPPPNSVEKELGETRSAHCTPIHMAFGDEIDMEKFPGSQQLDKRSKRKVRADYIWELVRSDYHQLKAPQRGFPGRPQGKKTFDQKHCA